MKEVTINLEESVYAELVTRAGGPRSISKFLNGFLPTAFAGQPPDLATVQREIRELRQELAAMKQGARQRDHDAAAMNWQGSGGKP